EAASLWTGTAVPTWRGSLYPHWSLARGTIQWIPTTWHGWRMRSRMGNISFARTVATSRFTMTSRPASTGSFNLSETLLRAVLCLALTRAQVWPLARKRDARHKSAWQDGTFPRACFAKGRPPATPDSQRTE